MTLRSAINEYLTYLMAEKGDSPKTIRAYENDLNAFVETIGNCELTQLSPDCLLHYQNRLQERGLKLSTIIRKSMAVKGLFHYLQKNDAISLPLREIVIPKREKKLPVYLTPEEMKSLLKQANITTDQGLLDYTMMLIDYSCGLRVSELVELRFDHLFLQGGYLKVFGKRRKERILPLSTEAIEALRLYQNRYRQNIQKNPLFVFVHKDGRKVSRQYFFLQLKKYAAKAHIQKNISPHTLRHSFATTLISNGAKLRQVQVLLGHDDIKTTEIYTHITHQAEKEAYEKAMHR